MKLLLTTYLSFICLYIFGQTDSLRSYQIHEVEVVASRPLRDIGLQQTPFDSTALQQCIALSMADVLSQNSVIFIKSYGRATMATASFRGTAPSHTQVTWNGMKLNSPMLGMVDFSYIPAYFIDNAQLYHGASSVGISAGGLGGAITLTTQPTNNNGFNAQYVQGFSSFDTYDQYLRLTYAANHWQSSTRILYTSSQNDFTYTNYYKLKVPIYDTEGNIVGQKYPTDRNRNCSYHDFHLQQEFYYTDPKGNRLGWSAWYMQSERGVPKLNVDYRENNETEAIQNENTFRTVVSWEKLNESLKIGTQAGYTYTDLLYRYLYDNHGISRIEAIHSQSYTHTFFGKAEVDYTIEKQWMFSGNVTFNQHLVDSRDQSIVTQIGQSAIIGYEKARAEISTFLSARYKPSDRWGFAINLRQDIYGNCHTPLIPAIFVDYLLSEQGDVVLKASIARNYRYPTLNDLYFMPGGNPNLQSEKGFTYDGSATFRIKSDNWNVESEIGAFDSYINDWILWRPTFKGFWTPLNIKKVHSYGLEIKTNVQADFTSNWHARLDGLFSLTQSVNQGEKTSVNDLSIGKQLPYIPVQSASITAKITFRHTSLTYKWSHYSRRFTTSSNDLTISGNVPAYYMNDLSIDTSLPILSLETTLRLDIHNLFNEAYETVLSHPMPGRNLGVFLGVKF